MKKNKARSSVKLLLFDKPVLIITIILISFYSCSKAKATKEDTLEKKVYFPEKNEVEVLVLKNESFQKELVSNGKLIATQKNSLKFEVSEKLEYLHVKNGSVVKRNQKLASLNKFKFQQKLDRAKINLKKASLEFEDMLLGRGIFTTHKDSIDKEVYEMVASRSGYDIALLELKTAEFELKSTVLRAPFNGKIANIQGEQFENVSAGKDFMTLINDAVFEVEFYLIESEIKDVAVNNSVQILPFALNKTYTGKVTSINPIVEKNGTILVKAVLKNDGNLTEGMNVKVKIQKEIKNQLVVPKSAVVLRQNQQVLFKVIEGKAFWTYVQTTNENSQFYSLIAHPDKSSAILQTGDTIIVTGNLNLAHDSEVLIKSRN